MLGPRPQENSDRAQGSNVPYRAPTMGNYSLMHGRAIASPTFSSNQPISLLCGPGANAAAFLVCELDLSPGSVPWISMPRIHASHDPWLGSFPRDLTSSQLIHCDSTTGRLSVNSNLQVKITQKSPESRYQLSQCPINVLRTKVSSRCYLKLNY